MASGRAPVASAGDEHGPGDVGRPSSAASPPTSPPPGLEPASAPAREPAQEPAPPSAPRPASGPASAPPASDPADAGGAFPPGGGMSWSWDLDLESVLDAVTGAAPWLRAPAAGPGASPAKPATADASADPSPAVLDMEADQAAYEEAVAAGRTQEIPLDLVAGRIAEALPTGPGLAGWLAHANAAELEDGALAGVAASFRRLASWAAAGELAAVAQIASRSARSDRRAEVDSAGRPDQVTADATGQVALALAMSHDGATSWTDLGVVLTWRLTATGAALAAGKIDLGRARMIARMTGALSDDAARAVEAGVLGRAGWLTLGQLHAALRRAVIRADPQGAERRREDAERNAKVVLYPEDEGTATLAGYSLPGVQAAAAMARIAALAKAMKAAGISGGIDLVRAQVFLGLLLGTLPYIPPAPGAPPDDGPPDDSTEDDVPPSDDGPPDDGPADDSPADDAPQPDDGSPDDGQPDVMPPGPAPGGGLLNLTVPIATLAGGAAPGQLSRLGVITAAQARELALLAAAHPATRWRVIVTTPAGRAVAVTHVPRSRSPGGGPGAGGGPALIGRVTLVVRADEARPGTDRSPPAWPAAPRSAPPGWLAAGGPVSAAGARLPVILRRALIAAAQAAEAAERRDQRDEQGVGCAHELASPAYRPPPRVAELVRARDGTCRFGSCRRPADRCDLDHTTPFDQGGRTCSCNLGPLCRTHHRVKQAPGWRLDQPEPGLLTWTTPHGRRYTVTADTYSV